MTLRSISQNARERISSRQSRAMEKALLDSVEMVHIGTLRIEGEKVLDVYARQDLPENFAYLETDKEIINLSIPHEGKMK